MAIDQKLSKRARYTLRLAIGSDHERCAMVADVNRWITNSGTEWTAARLKSIRVAALQLRSGNTQMVKLLYQENSISYRKGSLIPRGSFGPTVWRFVNAQSPTRLRRVELVLRLYTSLGCKTLTKAQFSKAKSSITSPRSTNSVKIVEDVSKVLEDLTRKSGFRSVHEKALRYDIRTLRPFTSTFQSGGNTEWMFRDVTKDEAKLPYGKFVHSLTSSVWLPESLKGINPCEEFRLTLESMGGDKRFAGCISFLQEPGAKARVVAQPTAWLQFIFSGLHKALDTIIRLIPESCVHDQNNGAFFIQSAMEKGETVHCFDLSSATDRFPIEWQVAVLKGLNAPRFAQALLDVSSYNWEVDTDMFYGQWNWKVGQPMGLYGSFPLFHLTHIMILRLLCTLISREGEIVDPVRSFRVLGDDVVITHPRLAKQYEILLKKADIPFSPSKSISSSNVGEFAGFTAIKHSKGVSISRPYKFGRSDRVNNGLSFIYALLGRFDPVRDRYWFRKAQFFTESMPWRNPDLSPIFSLTAEDFGEFGNYIDADRLFNFLVQFTSKNLDVEQTQLDVLDVELYKETACRLLGYEPEPFAKVSRLPHELLETGKTDMDRPAYLTEQVSSDPLIKALEKSSEFGDVAKTNIFGTLTPPK